MRESVFRTAIAVGAGAALSTSALSAQVFMADVNETLSFSDVATGTSVFTFDIPDFGAATDIDIFVRNSSSILGSERGLEVGFGGPGDGSATRVSDAFFLAGDVIDSFPTAPFSDPPAVGSTGNILFSEAVSFGTPSNNGQFEDAVDGDLGYIGFVLQADDTSGPVPGSFHFGYIELTFDDLTDGAASVVGAEEFTLTISKIALVTIPDVGIIAGGGAVPAPGMAGLLACAGLASARRRRH
ncbi:MAG: hypothetical protein AAGB34_07765 [Planctomycetota bacterium]